MGSDEMNFLNSMKRDISTQLSDEPEKYETEFTDVLNVLNISNCYN